MQLHELLNSIPAHQKTMIIDSHATTKFVELAQKEANYRLLLGTSPDLMAYETPSESPSGQWIHVGRFTQALVKQLAMHSKVTPLSSILPAVASSLDTTTPGPQRPVFVGNMEGSLLVGSGGLKEVLEAFDFSMRRNYDALALDEVNAGYQNMSRNGFPFLQLNLSYGRAFLEKGQYAAALAALQLADRNHARQAPEALLALGAAQLHNQKYEDAMTSLQEYVGLNIDSAKQLDAALQTMSELKNQRKHALLIGIDLYQEEDISPLRGRRQ
jgi:tetratricopeptide (TPR) repeat protein